jgi:hypothetical protein
MEKTLEDELKEVPDVVKKIRKQYGAEAKVGKINQIEGCSSREPYGKRTVEIVAGNKLIGKYEVEWDISGTFHNYNGKTIKSIANYEP